MHAAPSVIVFTVLSGAGFGALAFLSLGLPPVTGLSAFLLFGFGFALAVGGLVASTFHLGNPQRALRAFTQWRTSWLSREAWLSVAALVVIGLTAASTIFLGHRPALLGALGAALALATVAATSMIYAQLATVPRWNTPLTPACFLAATLAGGAIVGADARVAAALLVGLGALQLVAWRAGDGRFAARGHTLATATGLGRIGRPRLFEPPHTGTNYLLREFVHTVGRKHATKLRLIALPAMSLLPALLLLVSDGLAPRALAFAVHLAGMAISRWLFFAEAEHVVGLYYGAGPR